MLRQVSAYSDDQVVLFTNMVIIIECGYSWKRCEKQHWNTTDQRRLKYINFNNKRTKNVNYELHNTDKQRLYKWSFSVLSSLLVIL